MNTGYFGGIGRTAIGAIGAVLGLLNTPSNAAWTDHIQGLPIQTHFPLSQLNASTSVTTVARLGNGHLAFGSDRLLVYDGANWTAYPFANSGASIGALGTTLRGEILAAGYNEIGYYERAPNNRLQYRSLIDKVPEKDREFRQVWNCLEREGSYYYFSRSKILVWDGKQINILEFPTKTRLVPVMLDGELWFTHQESGLYRVTHEGPKLEYSPSQLPPRSFMWLKREQGQLIGASSNGFFRVGDPLTPLCSPEVRRFLEIGALTQVVPLSKGGYLLGTANSGIGIVSSNGELLRVLDQSSGLASNAINNIIDDGNGGVWFAAMQQGLGRIDASGSVSFWGATRPMSALSIRMLATTGNDTLISVTSEGLQTLRQVNGRQWAFINEHGTTEPYMALAIRNDESTFTGKYGAIQRLTAETQETVFTLYATDFRNLLFSALNPDRLYFSQSGAFAKLELQPNQTWINTPLPSPDDFIGGLAEDDRGFVWMVSYKNGLFRYSPDDNRLNAVIAPEAAAGIVSRAALFVRQNTVVFLNGPLLYQLSTTDASPTPGRTLPFLRTYAGSLSGDLQRLFLAFARTRPDGSTAAGFGSLRRDASGRFSEWTEYIVPGLDTIGTPQSMLWREEDGTDTIWLGGTEGLLRIKPAELTSPRVPQPPRLHLASLGAPALSADRTDFPFFGHRLSLLAHSPEIARRKELWFQTRVANRNEQWSAPSALGTFDFANLSDGQYNLEVRVVDAAGRISETAYHQFRILPPWYRTKWAFGGYALSGLLAVFGFIRIREHRLHLRAATLERTVAERTAELVKANAAKDEFLAGVSHEIRNPMNGVIGLAATLDPSRLDEANRKRLEQLRYCATHLSGLLEDILDFSRLQAGAVTLNPQTFDLPELIHSIGAITAVESAHAGIPVELAVSPAVPRFLVGDPARIRQILLNFVINALKYSGKGKVCVTVWSRQTKPEECNVTFAVSDDGPGISPEEQSKLFTRFERGAAARERRVGGTGLGLSVSKNLAEKMGGRLWLESEMGHGSTFYFGVTFPVDTSARPVEAAAKTRPIIAAAFRALVVDDEEYNRIALAALLEELGFSSQFARDGVEALAVATQERFDAIFLDVDLPRKSGLEVARELRARPDLPSDLPIVATTAFSTPEKRSQCLTAGMNGFLGKPVSIEKIRSALAAATAAQRAAAPIHPPGEGTRADPLASLRLLASRKNIPLAREISLYLDELETEALAMDGHITRRDTAAASRSAHRLTGRFAFIRAKEEEALARELEAAAVNELWDQAEQVWARLRTLLPELRTKLTSTN